MANDKSYKLKHPKKTTIEKRDHNTGVSDGTKKVLNFFLMPAL